MTIEDLIHLEWIHNRLIDVYGENRNTDFVTKLRTIINDAEVVNKNDLLPLVSTRYFAVGYVANVPTGHITGLLDVTTNGKYLNRDLTIGNIKEKQPNAQDIVITQITEMSQEDFEAWANGC